MPLQPSKIGTSSVLLPTRQTHLRAVVVAAVAVVVIQQTLANGGKSSTVMLVKKLMLKRVLDVRAGTVTAIPLVNQLIYAREVIARDAHGVVEVGTVRHRSLATPTIRASVVSAIILGRQQDSGISCDST